MGSAREDSHIGKTGSQSTPEYKYDGVTRKDVDGRNKAGHRAIIRSVKLLDVILVCLPFVAAWHFHYASSLAMPFYRRGNWIVIALYVCAYYLLAHLYSGFTIHVSRITDIVYAQSLASIITNCMMFIVVGLLMRHLPNVFIILSVQAVQMLLILLWSIASHNWYFEHFPAKETVIIYDELEGLENLVSQYGVDKHFHIIRKISVQELENNKDETLTEEEKDLIALEQIKKALVDAEAVFLCCLHSHIRNQIIKYCVSKDITSWCIPRIGDVIMSGSDKMHLFHLPILRTARYNPTPEYVVAKRLFDIVVAGVAFIVFSPIMLVLAILIRRDGGTVFYRQKRLTKDGKIFELLKFRSMRMDAEQDGVARLSTGTNDPRITKIGRFIRACRLDELPQLLNILKGDMSIVGPRPERPEIAEQYKVELPEFDLRLQCKCGLTGFAQVYGQYNTTPYDKLLMDLMYIAKPSMAEDLKICFATVKVLFMPESTEGVAEGQTTAQNRRQM